jgi:hypothetical protein
VTPDKGYLGPPAPVSDLRSSRVLCMTSEVGIQNPAAPRSLPSEIGPGKNAALSPGLQYRRPIPPICVVVVHKEIQDDK